jgi:hypothetical protein
MQLILLPIVGGGAPMLGDNTLKRAEINADVY